MVKRLLAALGRRSPVKPADGNPVMDRAEMSPQAPTTPDTVVVPLEATEKMLWKGWDGLLRCGHAGKVRSLADLASIYSAMLAARPAATPGGERDYPAEFEAWWATYKHRNRDKADYPVKKQIAFDAFYHAALSRPAPVADAEYRCPKCGAAADERYDCCEVTPTPQPAAARGGEVLLREASALFRHYEAHHRAKGGIEKAEINADIAGRIEAHLFALSAKGGS